MNTTLGIRYCGGCRSEFDRVAFVSDILARVHEHGLSPELCYPFDFSTAPAVGLVICGCPAHCVSRDETPPQGWRVIGPGNLCNFAPSTSEDIVKGLVKDLQPV